MTCRSAQSEEKCEGGGGGGVLSKGSRSPCQKELRYLEKVRAGCVKNQMVRVGGRSGEGVLEVQMLGSTRPPPKFPEVHLAFVLLIRYGGGMDIKDFILFIASVVVFLCKVATIVCAVMFVLSLIGWIFDCCSFNTVTDYVLRGVTFGLVAYIID
jgi:hypothetical protein